MSTPGKLAAGSEANSLRFMRREARAALRLGAWLMPPDAEPIAVETLDLSPRGAAVLSPQWIPPLAEVALVVEPLALPALAGRIRTARRGGEDGAGELLCRLGIAFHALPATLRQRLRVATRRILGVAMAEGTAETIDPVVMPALSASDRGRELLYQAAHARLEGQRFEEALVLAEWAHRGDPKNPFYRALVHRVAAERALSQRACEEATREVTHALALAPDDPDLVALRAHIDAVATGRTQPAPAARTYLSKLYR